jgi:hypothetical protein
MFENASGSCTSNMAPGRALSTFPSTSILSSFGIVMREVCVLEKIARVVYKKDGGKQINLEKKIDSLC